MRLCLKSNKVQISIFLKNYKEMSEKSKNRKCLERICQFLSSKVPLTLNFVYLQKIKLKIPKFENFPKKNDFSTKNISEYSI